ncbi:PKD domain-containing protein [Reichenbachiella agarivorans]|uniref:PKD domain-containing protein n=1 Tax=Reichenbachiella agarivorans TaxID=2979464 RepID=A0ABY6CUG6_9BACT|nr:PKD domain-containing protein [Reichenbachiella agarivorans]
MTVEASTEPVASFTSVANGLEVTFTNTSTNSTTYSWDFGVDGDDTDVSTDKDPVYTYATDGTYTVKLIASDDNGTTNEITAEVTVAAAAVLVVEFNNGTFDLYASTDTENYQKNNDMWEEPDGWDDANFQVGGMSTDGKKIGETKTNGIKFADALRGLYQEIVVEIGTSYTVTFDASTETWIDGVQVDKLKAYLLTGPITSETQIIDDGGASDNVYTSVTAKSPVLQADATKSGWVTYTMNFTAETTSLVFFLKSIDPAADSNNESWLDNIIITKD